MKEAFGTVTKGFFHYFCWIASSLQNESSSGRFFYTSSFAHPSFNHLSHSRRIVYIFSNISIAFFSLSKILSLPITSMLSNNGGLTFCPVTATRTRPST